MADIIPNKEVVFFAKTNFRNADRLFGVKRQDRRQHMYVIGKSGTGKSVLLHNMVVQDISNGEGVAVVDPHGELVEGILEKIPKERMNDVVYFNPADSEFHVGFNILEIGDPKYKHLVASGLMGIFTKIWAGVWSPRMEYILSNCVLALLETPGSTLLGIPRLLVDEDFRKEIISNITDPVVKAFWLTEYEKWSPQFRNEAIAPIQNKVGQFLSTPLIRNIVGQSKSTINIFDLMNEKKILLVNVSKGRIGEDNSALLGAMIITKIQLAAMERVRIPEEMRNDFYLVVDEFQNFATQSFANILSEARKYRLNLIMANQYIGQLVDEGNATVRDAVFGNVGTMIVFRVGAADAEFLEKEFEPEFTIQDIVNLPNYHIYLKLMVNGVSSRPFSAVTLPPFKIDAAKDVKEAVIEHSRHHYALSREMVEGDINKKSGIMENMEEIEAEGKFQAFCSSCGKSTLLPFKPEPGRPVYCKECLTKIKAGTLRPVKVGASYLPQSENKEPSKAPNPQGHAQESRVEERPEPKPPIQRDGIVRMEIGAPDHHTEKHDHKPVTHLSDLKPREEKPKQFRAPIDVDALRRAISESLKKDVQKTEEPAPKIGHPEPKPHAPHETMTGPEDYPSDYESDGQGPSEPTF